jgi:large conductance mechanosensitive channel
MLKEFKAFVLRGNVVDLAVGVVIGAAFGTVVTSLVADLLTPLIGAIAQVPDFSGLFFTLNGSKFMYGNFINNFISFFIVVSTIYFFVVLPLNSLMARTKKEIPVADPLTKKCPQCFSEIPVQAKRCPFCTSQLD